MSYHITELKTQVKILEKLHHENNVRINYQMLHGLPASINFNLEYAKRKLRMRVLKHIGMTGKYMPHQGNGECERRRLNMGKKY